MHHAAAAHAARHGLRVCRPYLYCNHRVTGLCAYISTLTVSPVCVPHTAPVVGYEGVGGRKRLAGGARWRVATQSACCWSNVVRSQVCHAQKPTGHLLLTPLPVCQPCDERSRCAWNSGIIVCVLHRLCEE